MLMNDSIKRVQSQAGLSFAERENQRSAAGGKANLRPEVKEKIFMKSAGRRGYSPLARVMTLAVMLLAMAATAWAQQTYTVTFSANNNTKTVENVTLPHTFSASYNTANEEFDLILKELYGWSGNPNHLYPATAYDLEVSDDTKVVSTKPDSYTQCLTINNVFEGSVTVNGTYVVNGSEFEYTVAISISAPTKYTVAMAEAGEGWTIAPAEATTTGVDKDTKITATYSGTKRVKSVTAVVKAAAPAGHALSASAVGEVVGTDGLAYAVADKDNLPTGVTAAGVVAYKSGSNGLVIAIADEASTMNWSTANGASGAAAHTPTVTGQTWKLPSQDEWKQMFSANGGSEGSYSGLNTTITNAGGTAFQEDGYWSSTVNDEVNAYSVGLYGGSAYFDPFAKDADILVRACLAF